MAADLRHLRTLSLRPWGSRRDLRSPRRSSRPELESAGTRPEGCEEFDARDEHGVGNKASITKPPLCQPQSSRHRSERPLPEPKRGKRHRALRTVRERRRSAHERRVSRRLEGRDRGMGARSPGSGPFPFLNISERRPVTAENLEIGDSFVGYTRTR